MSQEGFDPFKELQQIFIDNQRQFNIKCDDLMRRTKSFSQKLAQANAQLNENAFSANLNLYLSIEEEARIVLSVAQELEFHRDKIVKSLDMLKESNKIKLNKSGV
tara:strand:+ start:104 stop:418 length:315 start_codon:yes stop_codon:yes gene_type:complete